MADGWQILRQMTSKSEVIKIHEAGNRRLGVGFGTESFLEQKRKKWNGSVETSLDGGLYIAIWSYEHYVPKISKLYNKFFRHFFSSIIKQWWKNLWIQALDIKKKEIRWYSVAHKCRGFHVSTQVWISFLCFSLNSIFDDHLYTLYPWHTSYPWYTLYP